MISRSGEPQNYRSGNGHGLRPSMVSDETAFGYPRDFLDNQYVYLVLSPRAGGLSVGVNLNPVVHCNLNCLYCEVDRALPARAPRLDVEGMACELSETLSLAYEGGLRQRPRYARLPEQLLEVRHVALSGDGEPTLSRHFVEAMESVVHLRAVGKFPFFKIVVITNSTGLDQPEVKRGIRYLTREDEVWAKLDAGTQEYFNRISGSAISIEKITSNILTLGRERPVVIQSLFPSIDGAEPAEEEIEMYARRLRFLKQNGAEISLVQIYSATRPMARRGCGHLPLKTLSRIAKAVRSVAGLRAEVF